MDKCTIDEIQDILHKLPLVKIAEKAYTQLIDSEVRNGNPDITRFKIVKTNGKRSVKDNDAAVKFLLENGHKDLVEVPKPKAKGITESQKILKKSGLWDVYEEKFVAKSEGGEKLVDIDAKGEPLVFEPLTFETQ